MGPFTLPLWRTRKRAQPLIVLAGKEYGAGSSRGLGRKGVRVCWASRPVIAQSFERIHRSNLVGMGVLPLVFCRRGKTPGPLGLDGFGKTVTIAGISGMAPRKIAGRLKPSRRDGSEINFSVTSRLDTEVDVAYFEKRRDTSFCHSQNDDGLIKNTRLLPIKIKAGR